MPRGTISDAELAALRGALLDWYRAHARALPWRDDPDPWGVWVSEVMLQQTRVETVIPYYARFMARFATPRALADAPEPEVLSLWAGLGYYRRARMLHAGARAVVERHGGSVPADLDALRALPGVGAYTAGAVASIAHGLRAPLVDGNVERVLTRLGAMEGDPRRGDTQKRVWALAARLAEHPDPGAVNQSLMELGATVCAPRSPRCLVCPVRAWCAAHARGEEERYPEKAAKAAPKPERWTAVVPRRGEEYWLTRSAMRRWTGLLIPAMARGEPDGDAGEHVGVTVRDARRAGEVEHVLTHARMTIEVWTGELVGAPGDGALATPEALAAMGLPAVTAKVLASVTVGGGAPATRGARGRPRRAPRR